MAVGVRTSPRKTQKPTPVLKEADLENNNRRATNPIVKCEADGSEEEDDLPELAMLLGLPKTSRRNPTSSETASRGRGNGAEKMLSSELQKTMETRTKIVPPSASKEGGPEISQDRGYLSRSNAQPPANLLQPALPSLHPTKSQQRRTDGASPAKRELRPTSPIKRSVISSRPEKKKAGDFEEKEISDLRVSESKGPGTITRIRTQSSTDYSSSSSSRRIKSRPLKLAHVNSLLLPLSSLALEETAYNVIIKSDSNSNINGYSDEESPIPNHNFIPSTKAKKSSSQLSSQTGVPAAAAVAVGEEKD